MNGALSTILAVLAVLAGGCSVVSLVWADASTAGPVVDDGPQRTDAGELGEESLSPPLREVG